MSHKVTLFVQNTENPLSLSLRVAHGDKAALSPARGLVIMAADGLCASMRCAWCGDVRTRIGARLLCDVMSLEEMKEVAADLGVEQEPEAGAADSIDMQSLNAHPAPSDGASDAPRKKGREPKEKGDAKIES